MKMASLIPRGQNLVTYYILPLVKINRKSFGRAFHSSYIDRAGKQIFCRLRRPPVSFLYRENDHYLTELYLNDQLYIVFEVPEWHERDVQRFIAGKYSEMSKEAKKLIYNVSTLPFNKKSGSVRLFDPILQALEKTKEARRWLIERLGIEELEGSAELMPAPEDWWYIEHQKEAQHV
jgi:hypothetical protein